MGSSRAGSMNLHDMDSESEEDNDELRIPVFMVLLVLLAYTAIGGFLFQVVQTFESSQKKYF